MKKQFSIFIFLVFLGACSPAKKTTSAKPSPVTVTKTDEFRGGTSFENPIVIRVKNEKAGVQEEYKWLSNNYPGYTTIRKTQATREKRHYDIIRIRTREGQLKDVYFDTTSFFGKW